MFNDELFMDIFFFLIVMVEKQDIRHLADWPCLMMNSSWTFSFLIVMAEKQDIRHSGQIDHVLY